MRDMHFFGSGQFASGSGTHLIPAAARRVEAAAGDLGGASGSLERMLEGLCEVGKGEGA